jgi:cyclic pyranopterin phosphate synthase
MLTLVSEHFTFEKVEDHKNDTSRKYRIDAESKGVLV